MSSFYTQILTPTGIAFEGEIETVKIPGTEGGFEVNKGHASLISLMDIGVARIRKPQDKNELTYAISGGFTEVNDDTVIIMAEAAEEKKQIDVDRAKRAKERAEQRLQEKDKKGADLSVQRAEMALKRAANRIKVSEL